MKTKRSICKFLTIVFSLLLLLPDSSVFSQNPQHADARDDAWGYTGIGGGGSMFYPAVSPHNPHMAFVSCDMTGSYVTYTGGKLWQMFNLHGQVNFFVFDPLDTNVVYANSSGLFKSTDKGVSLGCLFHSGWNRASIE